MTTNRLEAFSDGVFAIATTLLVLEIKVPSGESLGLGLIHLWPSYLAYGISFVVIGAIWINHHAMFEWIVRVDQMGCALNRATGKCMPYPTRAKTWPAFSAMVIDDSGRSWFRLSGVRGDSIWVGFDANGRVLGKLLVPADGKADVRRIVQFVNGDVLLADDDADGARRVSIYRIVPVRQR